MLLPGTLCDAALWAQQRAALADHAEVQVGDLTRSASVASVADDVLGDAPETFSLAGFSLGAVVALEIMRRAPERVERLALLSANAGGSAPEHFAAWDTWEAQTRAGHLDRVLCTLAGWSRHHGEVETAIKTMGERVGEAAFLRQLDVLRSRVDSRPDLARIDCPTLLVAGRDDRVTPVAGHEEIKRALPAATLTVLACGHYSPLEQPEAVSAALHGWLEG